MAEEFNNQNQQNNFNPQPVYQAAPVQKKKSKAPIIIGIIAGVIVLIIIIGALSGGNDDKKTVQSADSSTSANVEENSENQEPKDEKVKAGSTVTLSDYKVTFISCDTNYTKYESYFAPEKGNKVVRAEFEFENTSDSDVSLSGFECYADNKKCEGYYGADDDISPTLESVSPGRTFKAIVYYEVPKDSKSVELEMEDDIWGDSKTVFVIE